MAEDLTNEQLQAQQAALAAEAAKRSAAAADAIQHLLEAHSVEDLLKGLEQIKEDAPTERMKYHLGRALQNINNGFRVVEAMVRDGRGAQPQS